MRAQNLFVCLGISLPVALLLGAGIAAASPGEFLPGFLAASVLLFFCFAILIFLWMWAGRGGMLGGLMVLAFVLRLGIGVGLSRALPVWGYQDPEQNKSSLSGYLFEDAYERDLRAWDLAHSDAPLAASFEDELRTDQYGGLLAVSAWVYRYISPDAHRSALILILGAFFAAAGLPFLWKAVRLRWQPRVALIAAWIYVLYPDAIFFGSSQMREPFLVGLSAVAFWAVLALERTRLAGWLALAASLAGMALFSSRVAVVIAGMLAVLFLLDRVVGRQERRWQVAGWLALALGGLCLIAFSWAWFRTSAGWDVVVTMRNSGRLLAVIRDVGEQWAWPIVIGYGISVPFFPAAVAEDAIPLWKIIGIVRSTGWYLLAPFLVYGFFMLWRETSPRLRRLMAGVALSFALWLVIAAARGGGDITDNPRYRSLLIVWMALLAGWAIDWALAHRDAWLWRWLAVEAIFLGFFTSWYFSRYFHIGGRLPFWVMMICIAALSVLVLAGGWLWDHWKSGHIQRILALKK